MTETYGPWLWDGGRFVEGGVSVSSGKVVEVFGKPPRGLKRKHLLLPLLVNGHTHIGDAFIKRVPKGSVEEIVAPPLGFKFRMLRKATGRQIIDGMRGALATMATAGTESFIDFRENGLVGVEALRMALKGQFVRGVILGRPRELKYSEKELRCILAKADGIGLSSISEWKRGDLEGISGQTRKAGKIFAIHASERAREPFAEVASLEPSFVVHMIKASPKDLKACADAEIPIVVCPRSNAFFGLKPPVRRMLDSGAAVALGTDNAMLAMPDMLAEARFLARAQKDLAPREVVQMAISGPRKVLNQAPGLRLIEGQPARFALQRYGGGDPCSALLKSRCNLEVVGASGKW